LDLKPGTRTNDKGETVNTLQMVSCVNTAQEIAMAKTEATLQRIFKDSAVETVTDDLINAITA
jgi:hypothetical protein